MKLFGIQIGRPKGGTSLPKTQRWNDDIIVPVDPMIATRQDRASCPDCRKKICSSHLQQVVEMYMQQDV